MAGRRRRALSIVLAAAAVALGSAGGAGAQVTPPWCGTPEPDAAGNLPDGSQPTHPAGSFPHIPYYAIGCTLAGLEASQLGNRMTVEVMGQSELGRDMYLVTINALDTAKQERAFWRWQKLRGLALDDPAAAQELLAKWGDDVKIPIYIQGSIHGNEYEGVDAAMKLIKDLTTTPYGVDPKLDDVLDHVIVLVNVVQNPDGRVVGQRANSNGFDMNRDFFTQSQAETKAAIRVIHEWLPTEILDLHGYTTPALTEPGTKPHNPGIDYDLFIKWGDARADANETALNAVGLGLQRPIHDWCPSGGPPGGSGLCTGGVPPGPAVAEGWDDWGPFYTPTMYVGLDGTTVETCNQTNTSCGIPGSTAHTRGRLGGLEALDVVNWSTMNFMNANRDEMLHDQLERYRRNVTDAPRPECCPAPFDVGHNWMVDYPKAFVIPLGEGQRSNAEANRLVAWLLDNGIRVSQITDGDVVYEGRTIENGSYVVWMAQGHRGIAFTALAVGSDISNEISQLYAPPGAWSHGYLWGADVVTIPDEADFAPQTARVKKPRVLGSGVEQGKAGAYALRLDSAGAVRLLNRLIGSGLTAQMALEPFPAATGGTLPAGTVLFAADSATKVALNTAARDTAVTFRRVNAADISGQLDPIDRVPRIVALTGSVNQDVWSLRDLGFPVDTVTTATINSSPTDPLVNYDVIWNTAGYPAANQTTGRARLEAFFAAGGGYMGAGPNGAAFLVTGGQVTGFTTATRTGNGRSGIIRWQNDGGPSSPIVGAYPAEDTAIVDPPTWFTSVPATMSVDARLKATDFFAAGLWLLDAQSASAPGSPLVVHGTNVAGTARLTNFAMSPLYRADPEREWPMVGAAAYWADQ